jgi:hypothetical protein
MVGMSRLSGQSFLDYRELAIAEFTGGQKRTFHELNVHEIDAMLHLFKEKSSSMDHKPGDRIRKNIFRYCYEMKVINNAMTSYEKVAAINQYIQDHPNIGLKKNLNKYSYSELQTLCYQFEVFYKYFLERL